MKRRVFTDEEKQFLLTCWGKMSFHQMREILNCSTKALEVFAEENGLLIPKSNRWTEEEITLLKEMSSVMSIEEIAHALKKSEKAVYQKGKRIGIIYEQNRRVWTKEEEQELRRVWGTVSIETISKKLNRSIYSIKVKANRLSLGAMYGNNPEWLTMNDISELLQVTRDKVEYWRKIGLCFKQKKLTKKYYYYATSWDDLLRFLEEHLDEWDSRKLDLNVFGEEFDWLILKRKKDIEEDPQGYRKWTKEEIDYVEAAFLEGMNYEDISKKIKRSVSSVAIVLRELGYSYRLPQFWKGKELLFLKSHFQDMTYEEIGISIGRSKRAVEAKAKQLGYKKRNGTN